MIPNTNDLLTTTLEVEEQPSKNYMMLIDKEIINGYCDELEAMIQTVYKILNTERYQYIIYSWDFGIETIDLYGEPDTYVCPELERRITEALTQDSRILYVDAFSFDINKGEIHVTFTVHTIYGDFEAEKAVNV